MSWKLIWRKYFNICFSKPHMNLSPPVFNTSFKLMQIPTYKYTNSNQYSCEFLLCCFLTWKWKQTHLCQTVGLTVWLIIATLPLRVAVISYKRNNLSEWRIYYQVSVTLCWPPLTTLLSCMILILVNDLMIFENNVIQNKTESNY
jgi:hypothetical protein